MARMRICRFDPALLSGPVNAYIGAGVDELKFRPADRLAGFCSTGEIMDAAVKPTPREQGSDHVHAAPASTVTRPSREQAEAAVRTLISYIGEDPSRDGIKATPKRVVAAFDELYRGYHEVPADALSRTFG